MNSATLKFDPTGSLEINYIQNIQLPDVVVPKTSNTPETTIPGGTQHVILQCTSYRPPSLELIHADCEKHGVLIDGADAKAIANWVADYVPPPPAPLTGADFEAALDAHLDTTARQRMYTDRFTCALRAGYDGPFRAEGQAFAGWMDACNAKAYELLSDVQAGKQPMPASPAAFIKQLPPMVWPS